MRLRNPTGLVVFALGFIGAYCLLAAAMTDGRALERAVFGDAERSLAWGPNLFRVLLAFHGLAALAVGIRVARRRDDTAERAAKSVPCAAEPVRTSPTAWLALAVLCGVALVLRLWKLGTCLWFDEVLTVVDFLRLPLREIVAVFPSQNQHMLYSVLGRISVAALGETAAAVRLPAVGFGVASIWALFVFARRISGTREALLACAVMTVSYHHVWFSQNARGYTGLLFFTLASTWCWVAAVRCGTARWWAGYTLFVVLGMWTQINMAFTVAAQGVTYLTMLGCLRLEHDRGPRTAVDPGYRWKAWVAWLFAVTGSLQVYALSLPEFLRSALHEESKASEWTNPWWVVREAITRLADGGVGSIAAVAALAVLAVGWFSLARRDWPSALLLVVPAVLGGGTMLALGHHLWPRFFFFCMGFVLVVAVRGGFVCTDALVKLARGGAGGGAVARVATIGCLALALLSAFTLPRCYAPPKQDFTGALAYVVSRREAADTAVGVGLAGVAYSRYFAPDWPIVTNAAQLAELRAKHARVWLVYTLPEELKAWHPEVWSAVQTEFSPVATFAGTLGGGEVVVCRSR
ncbi:MAG: glycosyltransferase family 39 protein [Planctomycetes bacterium]|nr:glycosyltransferase family 39 protein [Planctomycetota bacterium]